MTDQPRPTIPEHRGPRQSNTQSDPTRPNEAKTTRPPQAGVDVIAMVRSLQRAAGVTDCFRKGNADCDLIECDWRVYCLESPTDRRGKDKHPSGK